MELSQRITEIRKEMNLSQEKFGELVGMSQRSVAAWESGDRTTSFATLSLLADRSSVSVDWLLGRSEKRTEKIPIADDDELKNVIISRIQDLPDQALTRLSDFLDGIQVGREIADPPTPADQPEASAASHTQELSDHEPV